MVMSVKFVVVSDEQSWPMNA